jgi:hypothetical protein
MNQQGKGIYHIALHRKPIVKLCNWLSMSHQGESSLQKFQHVIEWLQYGINKGLDNNLLTTDIKEANGSPP